MRLLIVTQYFWPENFRINDLVAEFVSRGHEVTVLTGIPNYPDGDVYKDFVNRPRDFVFYQGARIVRVPMMSRGHGALRLALNYFTFAFSASILGPWHLRKYNFDVIFVYEPSPITVGIPAVILSKIKKIPMSLWVLDLWPETLEAIGVVRKKFILKLIGKLVSWIYNRSDLILAQSKSFIPKISEYTTPHAHIEYFPSWSESIFKEKNILPAKEVPVKPGTFDVVFTGNIGHAQDFPAILSAAELLKNYHHIRWIVVGDGRESEWLRSEITKRNLQSNVLMLGRYPVDRMPSFLLYADALLVSLRDEPVFSMTIPGKLQTYLFAGVPIIAMLNGEGAEIVHAAQAGLTCPAGDYKALANAVLKLSKMPANERELMGRNGVAIGNKEFCRDKLISQLECWLNDIQHKDMQR